MAKSTLAAQRFQLGLRDGPGEKAFVDYPSSLEDLILAAQSRPHTFSVAKFKQLELTEMGESGEKPFQKYRVVTAALKLCTAVYSTVDCGFSDRRAIPLLALAARLLAALLKKRTRRKSQCWAAPSPCLT